MQEFEEDIFTEAAVRFNLGSPKQIGEVLFDKMKIPYKGNNTKPGSTKPTKLQ